MSEAQSPLEVGLARFAKPGLSDLRPELLDQWKSQFVDPELASAISANPRFEDRITQAICLEMGEETDFDAMPDTGRRVIAALMQHGREPLCRLVGSVWHRPSVMEWITWNSLDAHLPEIDFALLRRCFQQVSPDAAALAGAPRRAEEGLKAADVIKAGEDCLRVWMASLPPRALLRLDLFFDPLTPTAPDERAELVTAVAGLMIEAKP